MVIEKSLNVKTGKVAKKKKMSNEDKERPKSFRARRN